MIRSLEGLRGLAALFVALFHLKVASAYVPPIQHGYLFVDLFFVLSGFVITGAYAGRLGTLRDVAAFLVRRWGRVFPLLLVCTALFVLVRNAMAALRPEIIAFGLVPPDAAARFPAGWPRWSEIATTLTLTHSMGLHDRLILNFATWSISVEFWTYVLFAALALTLPRRARWGAVFMLAAFASGVTVWASVSRPHACLTWGKCLDLTFDHGFARCVASFLLGSLAWELRGLGRAWAVRVQAAALIALCTLFFGVDMLPGLAFAMPLCFAGLIWSLAEDQGPVARLLSGRAAAMLGERSYSIYLLHPVLLSVIWPLGLRPDGWAAGLLTLALYVGCLVVLSAWTYRLVEVPARARCNALAARLFVGHAPATAPTAWGVRG